MMKKNYFFLLILSTSFMLHAQVGINTTTPQAAMDVVSETQGMLVPRVLLTSTQTSAPIINPQSENLVDGTIVYNTATAGTSPNNVSPGFYFWKDSEWIPIDGRKDDTLNMAYNGNGAGKGRVIEADAGALQILGTDGLQVGGNLDQGPLLDPLSAYSSQMFFYPRKGAFRAGYILGEQWIESKIGYFSVATGGNTIASGITSTAMGAESTASGVSSVSIGRSSVASGFASLAMGERTSASGLNATALGVLTSATATGSTAIGNATTASGGASTAMGSSSIANGTSSTAMGRSTNASGFASTAMGENTVASGDYSTAMGGETVASGSFSSAMGYSSKASSGFTTAFGYTTEASGQNSTAMGHETIASGDFSTAMGIYTRAKGIFSTAMGYGTEAPSSFETVIGRYNVLYTPNGIDGAWDENDKIFTVGNGSGNNSRSNALEVQKNGNLNITGSDAYKPGGGFWTAVSDSRLKKDVQNYSDGLSKILAINPITYHYNEFSGNDTSKTHVGVIAQDLQKIAPYMVGNFKKDGTEYLNVDNSAMIYMLINSVKELNERLQFLETENAKLKLQTNQ